MPITTRLTRRLKIAHPILSAPMDVAAGGRLAAAVSPAGGLGLIGGGYADSESWIDDAFQAAGNQAVGCGFITWALRRRPALLDRAIARQPAAIFLSFDDPEPFASKIKAAGIPLICQVQMRADAARAIDCGADVIVAQGGEAGGHGGGRATLTLVPELADLMAARAPDTLLCAAGGIADGRGLAAALMLGADGVVVGTRFWASSEAQVHGNLHAAALAATGDDTVRQSVLDIVRQRPWQSRYTGRVLKNEMIQEWLGREDDLRAQVAAQAERYAGAAKAADPRVVATIVGEAVGLIHTVEPAAVIIERMIAEAEALLRRGTNIVN
jgi:nitronate monooxygenase